MPEPVLRETQAWLMSRILAPCAEDARLASMVRQDHGASARARLAIYAGGYLQRLTECLRAEFPALRALVGDQVFDLFARGYLAARPSRSYSLYDLGAGFAEHLDATAPPPDPAEPYDRLPCELARLERARVESHRAAGPEDDPAQAALDPVDLFMTPGARVRIPATVRLLNLSFDLIGSLAATDRGERPGLPEIGPVFCAIARSRYRVRAHALTPAQFAFLQACTGGRDVQSALAEAARTADLSVGVLSVGVLWADLLPWTPWAIEAGLVAPAK